MLAYVMHYYATECNMVKSIRFSGVCINNSLTEITETGREQINTETL